MNNKVKKMVGIALFSAIIVVLQYLAGWIAIGGTTINVILIPVVVGAALYGWQAGAILGLVSGIAILTITPPQAFYSISFIGTIITVLAKGACSGLAAGLIYKWLEKRNRWVAVFAAALICPVVNTAIFVLGCYAFFFQGILQSAGDSGVFYYIMTIFVGVNFLIEVGVNMVLGPVIVRLIRIGKK